MSRSRQLSKKFYYEPVDPRALKYVLEEVLPNIPQKGRDENLGIRIRNMFKDLKKGQLRVSYVKKIKNADGQEFGREYAKRSLSFQNLNRGIRNALVNFYIATSGKKCVDIDIVNCHPELFLQLLKIHEVKADHDKVAEYVRRRDEILEEIKQAYAVDRDTAKCLLLALINFGGVKGWAYRYEVDIPPTAAASPAAVFLAEYEQQFRACVSELMSKMPDLVETAMQTLEVDAEVPWEYEACEDVKLQKRFVHILLTVEEDKVLYWTMDYILAKHVAVIISKMFDGCILQCEDDIDCAKIRNHVAERTGFWLKFTVKPFESPYTIPLEVLQDDDGVSELTPEETAMVDAIKKPTHLSVATLFYRCYPRDFVYTDSHSKWYHFESPRWKCVQGNISSIISRIDFELLPKIREFMNRVNDGEVKITEVLLCDSLEHQLGSISFKNCVANQLQSFYQVKDAYAWITGLDSNPDILALEDCVYDLQRKEFRDGTPDDMVTLSCGHTRSGVEDFDEVIADEIYDAVSGMFDNKEMMEYVWGRLSSCVSGRLPCDAFDIWTGKGRNGKGVIKALMASAFGNSDTGYYYEPDVLVFTTQRQNASGPCPELAKFKGKRCCMSSEGNTGDALQLALLKKLTGGDIIQARELNKSFVGILPTFNLFLLFNVVPSVNDTSNATKRRLRINDFPFEYCEDPKLANQKQIDEGLRDRFASKPYGAAALGVMIQWFNEYGNNVKPPKCVRDASANFMLINDPLSEFMLTHFVQGGRQDIVLIKDVMAALKNDPNYRSQIGIKRNSELIQNLRNKDYEVPYSKKNGYDYIIGLLPKQSEPVPEDD